MLKQIFLPCAVLAVLASMLLPLPTIVLDFLIVSNLILAMTLLLSSMYISDSLKLSSLPTILLLSTLYRLALNISTTRLILGTGDAGRTVEAFGNVVIQGNIVVGIIVFLIITLVQFIVIAKGSERVAEVSARFTLDAMPGKQMSIDADVRAGLIDFETARKKREELQTESRFYGSLDGAMKFIKGDAIAGIIVCVINLIGGFAIGLISEGLDLSEAISKYSILSVGDGLVSQIPALLSALAAGLVVTRVSRGDGTPLATEVWNQLGQVRTVKLLIGGLCTILAFVPGIPALPFAVLGIALLVSAHLSKNKTIQVQNEKQEQHIFQPRVPALLQVEMTRDCALLLSSLSGLNEQVDQLRQNIFEKLGLILNRPDFIALKRTGIAYRISMHGISIELKEFNEDEKPSGQDILNEIISKVENLVEQRVVECIDDILTRRTLDFFDKEAPELVSSVVPSIASVTQITFILKALAAENVSIKNFGLILQAIAECAQKVSGERAMLEEVRVLLKRVICQAIKDENGQLNAFSLDPIIDLSFVKSEKAAQPIETDFIDTICETLSLVSKTNFALITSKSARKLVRECLETRGIKIPVIAFDEVPTDVRIEWLGGIELKTTEAQNKGLERLAA